MTTRLLTIGWVKVLRPLLDCAFGSRRIIRLVVLRLIELHRSHFEATPLRVDRLNELDLVRVAAVVDQLVFEVVGVL